MIASVSELAALAMWVAILAGSVALGSLYSGMETGIYVLNKIRLDLRAEAGERRAGLLRRLINSPNNLLAVLLIGTNLASYVTTFTVSMLLLQAGLGQRAGWYTLAVVTPTLFIFRESVPKNVFQRLAETLVYRFARLIAASSVLLNACGAAPLVRGFSWLLMRLVRARGGGRPPLGHAGIPAVVAEGRASGVLTHFQSIMAQRIMNIADVTLQDAMIPMRQVVSAPLNVTRQQLLDRIRDHNYSRLPLLDEAGGVAGVLNIYHVLAGDDNVPPREKINEPFFLPATMTVTDALYRMQRAHAAMAIVTDQAGKPLGLVTIKDLVEEIVGELEAW